MCVVAESTVDDKKQKAAMSSDVANVSDVNVNTMC